MGKPVRLTPSQWYRVSTTTDVDGLITKTYESDDQTVLNALKERDIEPVTMLYVYTLVTPDKRDRP